MTHRIAGSARFERTIAILPAVDGGRSYLYGLAAHHLTFDERKVEKEMNEKFRDKNMDFLFQAVLTLKTPQDCARFFEDLCTVPELKAMSQRLEVARMLSHKQVYSDIVAETGASTATISRVNRALNYGSDGYALVFERMDEAKEKGN